jgi:hypothetical protein
MKILKCLMALAIVNVFTMEITELDLESDVKRQQEGPVTKYSIEFNDNEGKKEVGVSYNRNTDKYQKTQKIFLPTGIRVQTLYQSPSQLKAQFDRLRTRYNTDHGIIESTPEVSLQSLLARLSLAEQEFQDAKTSYETGPSSRSNIND